MRTIGVVVLSLLLSTVPVVLIVLDEHNVAQAASAAADMAATPDDGFITISPSTGVFTIGNVWSPPDPVRCKKGHVVSPYPYTVSYWDDQGRHHNVEFKVCPLCYVDSFRTMMTSRPVDVVITTMPTPLTITPTLKGTRKKP